MSYSDKTTYVPLDVSPSVWEAIRKHGEESYPFECCGFLYGKDGETRTINNFLRAPNSKEGDQRRRFEISPIDYLKAERFALNNKLDFLGIYHSHPDHPALPSKTETDAMAGVPGDKWMLISASGFSVVKWDNCVFIA